MMISLETARRAALPLFLLWLALVLVHIVTRNLGAPQWLSFALDASILPLSVWLIWRASRH